MQKYWQCVFYAMLGLLVACSGVGDGTEVASPSDGVGEMSSQDDFGRSPLSQGNGGLTDSRDGKSYKTVRIGSQTWMAENLNYKTENSYCYDDDPANCNTYGRIYTWPAAVGMSEEKCGYGHVCGLVGTVRGVCPLGWHVPSKEDWETLIAFVGGKSVMGEKLKSSSGWEKGNGSDDFGFSALPGGYRHRDDDKDDEYDGMGEVASFWSSTEYSPRGESGGSAYSMNLIDDDENPDAGFYAQYKNFDICYVRCIKD